MSEKRFICGLGFPINSDDPIRIISDSVEDKDYYKFSDICNVLNEQQSEIQKWRNLYELKDSEVTARVDTLNRVCKYYLSETRFKGDTNPNDAVKEVINEILNAPIYEE